MLQELVEPGRGSFDEWGKVVVTVTFWVLLPLAIGMLGLRRGDFD